MALPRTYSTDASGRILGLDMPAFIQFSMACGHDMEIVAEFLSAANSAFLFALKQKEEAIPEKPQDS